MLKQMTVMVAFAVSAALPLTALAAAHAAAPKMGTPDAPFVQVSDVLPLPAFLPGLGTLFVDPATLPAGPFLSYDRDQKLSATVYMTPFEDLRNGTAYDNLSIGSHDVTSVDIHFNGGHPGVEKPHAHVILYHDAGAKSRLAK